MFGFMNRDRIDIAAVKDEFDNIYDSLRAIFFASKTNAGGQHKEDGSHGIVTADSVKIQGSTIGEVTTIAYDAARFTSDIFTWQVDAVDFEYIRFTRVGQLVTLWFGVSGTSFPGGPVNDIRILMPELHLLPAIFNDGSGLIYSTYLGGMCRYSDASGEGYCEVRARETPLAGTPSMNVFMQKSVGTFSGVDCDFHGYVTFPVQYGNVPTNYAIA